MAECEFAARDEDVFGHMLATQMVHVPPHDFLGRQPFISHNDHQRVADWMLEVCECFKAEKELFVVSMLVLDRFLVSRTVTQRQLQLFGATALLIGSKLIGPAPFHVETLCGLIHQEFNTDSMKIAELEMLKGLDWSLEAHRPHDFLEMFLGRLLFPLSPLDKDRLRKHGEVFIDMCYTDANFVPFGPAVIAATALFCAACGVGTDGSQQWVSVPPEQKRHLLHLDRFFSREQWRYIPRCIDAAQELFLSYDVVDEPCGESINSSPLCVRDVEQARHGMQHYEVQPIKKRAHDADGSADESDADAAAAQGRGNTPIVHRVKRTRN